MTKARDAENGKYTVQILSRAVAILSILARETGGVRLEELVAASEVSKASVLRILRTLTNERLIVRTGDTYQLGPRVLEFSLGYLTALDLGGVAKPVMEGLAKRTNQTVSLAIRDGLEVVYVAIERAQQEIGIQGEIGGRHPANATALGKVLLADLEPHELRPLLEGVSLPRLTHRTIIEQGPLERHLDRVRSRGYALDDEERGIGIKCIAAPIRDAHGRVIAAMSVAGPIFHMTEEALPTVRDELLLATRTVSERFGFTEHTAST